MRLTVAAAFHSKALASVHQSIPDRAMNVNRTSRHARWKFRQQATDTKTNQAAQRMSRSHLDASDAAVPSTGSCCEAPQPLPDVV